MEKFETGAVRDIGSKGRMDLLPMCALMRVSRHMENALTHYPERNWEKGLPMHTMIDSALRHIAKYVDGRNDEDHLCAAATNLLMALWTEEKQPNMQDIPSRVTEGSPFVSEGNGSTGIAREPEKQKKAKEGHPKTNIGDRFEVCSCYHIEHNVPKCWGTQEKETCFCTGDKAKCDFYR